ncbi:MAG TPA: SpoIIE family protein phosphatase [Acidobacteriaceae bacterium]|nr:SpoIIE family protein phosphatase [Acidobacteriaceae bacterium]
MHRRVRIAVLITIAVVANIAYAQSREDSQPVIRCHCGDNLAWADAQFDDGAWPEAKNGSFPAPACESDGFFWVRARIAVPAGIAGPLAIEAQTPDSALWVLEVWVNGRLVGRYGNFPPHAHPLVPPQRLVFDIPAGVARPGSAAVVALRASNDVEYRSQPLVPGHPDPIGVEFSIGSAPLLHALAAQAQDRARQLGFWPQFSLVLVLVMLGLAALALGIWARDSRLLLCALWLVAMPAFLGFGPLLWLLAGVGASALFKAFLVVNALGMGVGVEFLWIVQGFRDRFFRSAAHLCWIGLTVAMVYSSSQTHPGAFFSTAMHTGAWLLLAYSIITSGANLAALAGRGRSRLVALAMLLISVGYFFRVAGNPVHFEWLGLNFLAAAIYLSALFIALLLMRQTWTAWRRAEGLRVEFAAAREVQRQLVPADPPAIAGWRMQAAYLPAMDVGGDFCHVIEQPGAAALLVGDVSGRGLKAAMTGLLTIGAASALASDSAGPAELLERLNRRMVRLQKGGFISCLCARIEPDGTLAMASAGHLSPYRNGDEIRLDSGLPLGITSDATCPESTLALAPGDTLTFLSDVVVDARDPAGELLDRTRDLSTQSAEEIARAAQSFGQQDDITILTLSFAPAEVTHA